MDDNPWDSVTRLGKSRSGGGVEREKVAKGKAAINAAMRNGKVLYTEKKVGSANSVRLSFLPMLKLILCVMLTDLLETKSPRSAR